MTSPTASPALQAYRDGSAAYAAGKYAAALEACQSALELFRQAGNERGEAGALMLVGGSESKLSRYADGLQSYQLGLALYRHIGDRDGEARALANIGQVEGYLSRYADALQVDGQALALLRQLGDRVGEADALDNAGNVETGLGRYADAIQSHTQALALFEALRNRQGEMNALNNLGNAEKAQSRYADALQSYQQAHAISAALGNHDSEARALGNIATTEEALGRYADALHTYQQALGILRELGDRDGAANMYNNIGNVADDLGMSTVALGEDQLALGLYRQVGNRDGEARVLGNIGNLQKNLGRYDDALQSEQQALALDRELGDRDAEARSIAGTGLTQALLGHNADAVQSEQQALALYRELGDRQGEAGALNSVAVDELALVRFDDALASARQAVDLDGALATPQWRDLRTAAAAEAKLDRIEPALADYDRSIDEIERLRAGLDEDTGRSTFFTSKLFVYDEYIAYLLELNERFPGKGYDRKALDVLERKAARATLEQIGRSAAHHFKGVAQQVVADEDAAGATVDSAQALLMKLLGNTASSAAAVNAAKQNVDDAKTRLASLDAKLKTQYPGYYELRHPQPLDVAGLQGLLRPGELMLVYDLLPKQSALWAIDRDHVELVPLAASKDLAQSVVKAGAHVDGIIAALDSGKIGTRGELEAVEASDLPKFAADSFALYQQLIPASVAQLIASKKVKSLVIVPSGALYRLAFETLVTVDPASAPSPHYLIEDVPISYVPSASLLAVVRRSYAQPSPARGPLLAFANPAYDAPASASADPPAGSAVPTRGVAGYAQLQYDALRSVVGRTARSGAAEAAFPPLPGTQVEANAIRSALGASQQSLIVGDDASRARVLALNDAKQLQAYQYLVFATHAVLPNEVEGVTQPAIVLAHPDPRKGDGFLTMADVFGLALNADFVALSACDTGVATQGGGDGISGLTRAFLYAGTPAISVTLWEVDDEAAPQLTPPFFAGMHAGKLTPAEALRAAKRAMIASPSPGLHHPYAWAPAVIFGDGDTHP
ncbi:MAG: CHAT domain-containing protein [Vulcanimicrobiaceae bacterium]